jgi:hypothetical protein
MKLHCTTKTILTLCIALFSIPCFSQVSFYNGNFRQAMDKAAAEGKFVLVQLESPTCEQCNDVANKGFENKELATRLEESFVSIKIDGNHTDRSQIFEAYHLQPKTFGSLFLDNNGTLLHSFLKTTTFSKDFLKQVDITFEKAGEVLQISRLEKEYKNGNRSYGFLELLIQKRRSLNLATDSLLEEYVAVLPADSLQSIKTLVFIAQMAPMLDSKADRALRSNQALFNRAWYSMDAPTRVRINNLIIYKGISKAVSEMNEKFAMRTASFAQATNSNPMAGAKAYDTNMLRFYDETKDTTNYFRKSIAYYERYLLTVTPDSIKRSDSMNLQRMMASAKKDTTMENGKIRTTARVSYAPAVQRFSSELNNGAYNFYTRTNNPYLLSIATEWAKRALEFYESPEALDTYARLLYKQNQKAAAIEEMTKAVTLQKKRGFPTKSYEEVLMKMKQNAPLTN